MQKLKDAEIELQKYVDLFNKLADMSDDIEKIDIEDIQDYVNKGSTLYEIRNDIIDDTYYLMDYIAEKIDNEINQLNDKIKRMSGSKEKITNQIKELNSKLEELNSQLSNLNKQYEELDSNRDWINNQRQLLNRSTANLKEYSKL